MRGNPLSVSQKNPLLSLAQKSGYGGTVLGQSALPVILPSKVSQKQWGVIHAYSANTHNGIARPYNEDRVSIVLDLRKSGNGSST